MEFPRIFNANLRLIWAKCYLLSWPLTCLPDVLAWCDPVLCSFSAIYIHGVWFALKINQYTFAITQVIVDPWSQILDPHTAVTRASKPLKPGKWDLGVTTVIYPVIITSNQVIFLGMSIYSMRMYWWWETYIETDNLYVFRWWKYCFIVWLGLCSAADVFFKQLSVD